MVWASPLEGDLQCWAIKHAIRGSVPHSHKHSEIQANSVDQSMLVYSICIYILQLRARLEQIYPQLKDVNADRVDQH